VSTGVSSVGLLAGEGELGVEATEGEVALVVLAIQPSVRRGE